MKRKTIQIAGTTQVISLPKEWTNQYNVKKGDELEVEIKGNRLEVSTEKNTPLKEISLDVSELDRTSTMLYIRSAYRKGFDNINVNFTHPTTPHFRKKEERDYISVINSEVNRLVGLEVVKQTENLCELKDFSDENTEEFSSLVVKVFLQINDAMKDLIKGFEKNDTTLLKTIEQKHDSTTKFISYCLRLLNKKHQFEVSKSHMIYHIISSLDLVMDIIKYSARRGMDYNKPLKKESIKICRIIQDALSAYYDLFYKFKLQSMSEVIKLRDEVIFELNKELKIPTQELLILNDMKLITDIIRDLAEAKSGMEL